MSQIDDAVGVIIPVYNRPRLVLKTLDSVAKQSVLPGKLVIIDDGSTDNTAEAVQQWIEHQRTRFDAFLISTDNRGVSAASNRGLQELGGCEYVAILGSDDLWPESFIDRMTHRLRQETKAVAVTCDRLSLNWKTSTERRVDFSIITDDPVAFMIMYGGGFVSQSMLRLNQVLDAGGFCETMPTGQDSNLFMRIALMGPWLYESGEPVIITKNSHLEYNEEGHIHQRYPYANIRWANDFDSFVDGINDLHPNRNVWRDLVATRWYRTGLSYQKKNLYVIAHLCFSRAVYWKSSSPKYLVKYLINLIKKSIT